MPARVPSGAARLGPAAVYAVRAAAMQPQGGSVSRANRRLPATTPWHVHRPSFQGPRVPSCTSTPEFEGWGHGGGHGGGPPVTGSLSECHQWQYHMPNNVTRLLWLRRNVKYKSLGRIPPTPNGNWGPTDAIISQEAGSTNRSHACLRASHICVPTVTKPRPPLPCPRPRTI